MHPAGFEPTIPANELPQIHALDHAATGMGCLYIRVLFNHTFSSSACSLCRLMVTEKQVASDVEESGRAIPAFISTHNHEEPQLLYQAS
jgi:hypothetical protein